MKKYATLLLFAILMAANGIAQTIIPNDTFDLGHRASAVVMSDDGSKALTFYIDSITPKKYKPKAALYDLTRKTYLWTKECSKEAWLNGLAANARQTGATASMCKSKVTKFGSFIMDKGKCEMVADDGKSIWQIKIVPVCMDEKHDLVLGYSNVASGKLRAYKLSDGQPLWQQDVKHQRSWGWDEVAKASDSLMIIPADQLYFLNPISGNLWAYKVQNGFQRTGNMLLKALAAGMAGGVMGAAAGVYVYPIYNPGMFSTDVVTKTCSNIYKQGGNYYFSDRDRLSCLDANGNAVWTHDFPSRIMGNAQITGDGNRITVVNYAFGLAGGTQMKVCGKPFVASFDAATGKMLYSKALSDDKDMVTGAYVGKDDAFIMFPDRIVFQQLCDSTIQTQKWNTTAYGALTSLVNDTIYTFRLNDQTLTPLYSDSTHCVVFTDKGEMKVVDNKLNITDDYQLSNVFIKLCGAKGMALVTNDDKDGLGQYILIKDNGEPIGDFKNHVCSTSLRGDCIYIHSENKIYKITLTDIKNEKSIVDSIDGTGNYALR